MKKCPYCGAEYPDDATVCAIDQTPFEEKETPRMSEASRIAITTGLATFFINTGIYYAVGRINLNIFKLLHPDYVVPPYVHEIINMSTPVKWLLTVGFVVFTFIVCWMRCRKNRQAIVVAIIALALTTLLLYPSRFPIVFILPAFFIGFATDSSAGYYVGSTLQIIIGAWLLGWFGRRKDQM